MALEKYIITWEEGDTEVYPRINLHLFRAILEEVIEGKISDHVFTDIIEENIGTELTESDITDIQKLLTSINDCEGKIEKFLLVDEMYRVLIISESKISLYDTREKLRGRLGWQ